MARKFSFGDISNDNLIIGVALIVILISIFVMFSLSQGQATPGDYRRNHVTSSDYHRNHVTSSDYHRNHVTSSDYPRARVTSSDYN